MLLNICSWFTLIFLLSVVAVAAASFSGYLPALADIGRSHAGMSLSLAWLLGLVAMLIHIAAVFIRMVRARHWLWLLSSCFLAPFTTLYYFWFVVTLDE